MAKRKIGKKDNKKREQSMQKGLLKILNYKFIILLDRRLNELDIPRYRVSERAGKHSSSFNKTFAKSEDLHISTFLRYWITIIKIIEEEGKNINMSFNDLIDDEMKSIVKIISELYDEYLDYIAEYYSDVFLGFKVYVEKLKTTNSLNEEEINLFNDIYSRLGDN